MIMMINLCPETVCRITLQPHAYLCMINFAMEEVWIVQSKFSHVQISINFDGS